MPLASAATIGLTVLMTSITGNPNREPNRRADHRLGRKVGQDAQLVSLDPKPVSLGRQRLLIGRGVARRLDARLGVRRRDGLSELRLDLILSHLIPLSTSRPTPRWSRPGPPRRGPRC